MRKSGWYIYAVSVWMLTVIASVAACFTGMNNLYAWILFLIMPEWFAFIHTANREKLSQYDLISECPPTVKKLFLCCVIYGLINFALGMFLLRNGGPHIHEGIYCLWNHGFIREITESEYKSLLRAEGRMFTGNHLIFSTVAMAYFAVRERIHLRKME